MSFSSNADTRSAPQTRISHNTVNHLRVGEAWLSQRRRMNVDCAGYLVSVRHKIVGHVGDSCSSLSEATEAEVRVPVPD